MKVYNKTGNEIDLTVKNDISSIQNIITPVTEGSTSLNDMQTTGIFRIYDVNTETPISDANGLLFVFCVAKRWNIRTTLCTLQWRYIYAYEVVWQLF